MKKLITVFILFFNLNLKAQTYSDSTMNKFISDWIGKPYKFGGTSKYGIDCSALTQKFYEVVFGYYIPRTCYYQFQNSIKISSNEIKIGDIIFFKSSLSPSGWHCGIYIGDNKFLHSANRKEGVKISYIDERQYTNKIKGFGRYEN